MDILGGNVSNYSFGTNYRFEYEIDAEAFRVIGWDRVQEIINRASAVGYSYGRFMRLVHNGNGVHHLAFFVRFFVRFFAADTSTIDSTFIKAVIGFLAPLPIICDGSIIHPLICNGRLMNPSIRVRRPCNCFIISYSIGITSSGTIVETLYLSLSASPRQRLCLW